MVILMPLFAQAGEGEPKACWAKDHEKHANKTLCWFRDSWRNSEHAPGLANNTGPVILGFTQAKLHEKTSKTIRTCVYKPPQGEPVISSNYLWLKSKSIKAVQGMNFETAPDIFVTSVDLCDASSTGQTSLDLAQSHTPSSGLDLVCQETVQTVSDNMDYSIVQFRYRDNKGLCTVSIGAQHIFFSNGSLATVFWAAAANNGWPIQLKARPDGTFEKLYGVSGERVVDTKDCKDKTFNKHLPIGVYDKKRCQSGYLQDPSDTGKGDRKNTGYENLAYPW